MTKRVKGAMIYPAILVTVCYAVMYFLAAWVVPEFKT